jgi:hypothetical protein
LVSPLWVFIIGYSYPGTALVAFGATFSDGRG